jgi:tRNA1(Val) A37 N6-methylase TrmN6
MKLKLLTPKQSLKKAFLKQRPLRSEIERFKSNLITLLAKVEAKESEENKKNHVRDFLLDTYYKGRNEVNTKDRKDLVIHLGKTNVSNAGVILEAKSLGNNPEMMRRDRPNSKAFRELVLYYFDERIDKGNAELKHLIATNAHEWFIFDANVFDKHIYRNTPLKRLYEIYKNDGKSNPFIYDEIKTRLEAIDEEIPCTYFNLKDYGTALENDNPEDDKNLIALFKILSPVHLLKEPFADDSNALKRPFYIELLHLIGLEEVKKKNKIIIRRKEEANRNEGSLLENAITILKTKDSLRHVRDISNYGESTEERYFNVALELCITWINRILFLRLLESQLVSYHEENQEYRFLNFQMIPEFDELFTLFHQVLAIDLVNREAGIREQYKQVPYLNSSLFEISDLEDQTISIESLKDTAKLPFIKTTVLKALKAEGKTLSTLEYLFRFLDAYDFASEGGEDVQEDTRTLINASVLGKVFEKINGYKEGSIFTPGFITMYICREVIRPAVIQKFKDKYGWNISEFADLSNYLKDRRSANDILEFNELINSLHICDPAVGSGHFLVSSLNEIIAIKSELGLFADSRGVRLSDYEITIENDELIITDEKGDLFDYQVHGGKPAAKAHRLQKALFHEKQTIIENCLFGVDINPNSVKICRLRLWIELLKNAYYKESNNFAELETLPNIDINIKCGNSLLSRFSIDEDISLALKRFQYSIDEYKEKVSRYKNERNRESKRELLEIIDAIKGEFRTEIFKNDKRMIALRNLEGDLFTLQRQGGLFGETDDEKDKRAKKETGLITKIDSKKREIEEIRSNAIYRNAFEWRFEFPEVLDNGGNFLGFDVILGNPPYMFGGNEGISRAHKDYFKTKYETGTGKINLFNLFIERGRQIITESGQFSFIIPNTFLRVTSYDPSRRFLFRSFELREIADFGDKVFDGIITTAIVLIASAETTPKNLEIAVTDGNTIRNVISKRAIEKNNFVIALNVDSKKEALIEKLQINSSTLGDLCKELIFGVVITKNKELIVSETRFKGWKPFLEGNEIEPYLIRPVKQYLDYNPKLLHRPRTKDIFEVREKLLIQRITGGTRPLKAAYDDRQLYNKESINNIILKDDSNVSIKYVLGIINSKLLNWFYATQFTNNSNLTVNLSKKYLSQIPVKMPSKSEETDFVKIVNAILRRKMENQETAELERQIDAEVYRLYELTNEEIGIVEGKIFEIPCDVSSWTRIR